MWKKLGIIFAVSFLFGAAAFNYLKPTFYGYSKEFTVYDGFSSSVRSKTVGEGDFPLVNACGESFTVNNGEITTQQIIDEYSGTLVFTEKTEQGESFYAYSEKIATYVKIFGKKVNLHIFVGNEITVVGSPIIFGSF